MQKMSKTNHENNSSRALNVPIQTMASAQLPNPEPEKPEKFDGTKSRGDNRRYSFTWTLCIWPNSCKKIHRNPDWLRFCPCSQYMDTRWLPLLKLYFKWTHDSLYNIYSPIPMAKKLWASLDKKYKTKDAGTKKFIVGWFLRYKMVDRKLWSVKCKSFNLSCTR